VNGPAIKYGRFNDRTGLSVEDRSCDVAQTVGDSVLALPDDSVRLPKRPYDDRRLLSHDSDSVSAEKPPIRRRISMHCSIQVDFQRI
jgi:hypothetical protein